MGSWFDACAPLFSCGRFYGRGYTNRQCCPMPGCFPWLGGWGCGCGWQDCNINLNCGWHSGCGCGWGCGVNCGCAGQGCGCSNCVHWRCCRR